eukprot:jgi/Ulvmu1/1084/UM105_0043.1
MDTPLAPLPALSARSDSAMSFIAEFGGAPGPASTSAAPKAPRRPADEAGLLCKTSPWVGCMLALLACITFTLLAIDDQVASLVGQWSPSGRRGTQIAHSSRDEVIAHSSRDEVAAEVAPAGEAAHTLVLYVWSNTDEYYRDNLQFFVKHGMPGCNGCRYVVIINEDDTHPAGDLPQLPANARYVRHENRCYDWGTFGWALQSGVVSTEGYKYFIFLNSSVRGPFLPPYLRGLMHFTEIMTRHISADVKLVGPTISCGQFEQPGGGGMISNPHVQSFAVATDTVGLDAITRNGSVLACYSNLRQTVAYSEFGLSSVLLDAGFNIGCFISKYEGMDWRDRANWGCNGGTNPLLNGVVDGVPLAMYELLFVKVKSQLIKRKLPAAMAALAFDQRLNRSTADGV